MALVPRKQSDFTAAASAGVVTAIAEFSISLLVARFGGPSIWNGLWMFGVPALIGLLAFRTWPGKLRSILPLTIAGIIGVMASGPLIY